jgi:hypothetical protein
MNIEKLLLDALSDKKKEPEENICDECEGGGWVGTFCHNPPCFKVCDKCYNEHNLPSP